MSDVQAEASHLEIIFHNDDETPVDVVVDLLHSLFKKQIADAIRFTEAIKQQGQASCGTYPRDVAEKLLKAAQKAVRVTGIPLRITSKAVMADDDTRSTRCKLCGTLFKKNRVSLKGMRTLVCDDCMYEVASNLPEVARNKQFDYACEALAWHFAGIPRDQLVSTSRLFPGHMRADVQAGIDRLLSASPIRFFGIHEEHRYETLSLTSLTRDGRNALAIAPAQYHDVEVGESAPVKCLNNGLWLCRADDLHHAVVLSSHREYGYESGTRIEIAVPVGADGAAFVQRAFSELESAVNDARCYRGKVLSLDGDRDYHGRTRGIMVHKLPSVQRRT
jgi:ATP-dependent Clp protease adapter protein ClpS